MRKRDNFLRDGAFLHKFLILTIPLALQGLLLASVAACDAFMLGRVDQNSMASVSLASQIQFIQNMIVSSAVAVEAILGAQYWGKGDSETIAEVFFMTLRLSGITSLLFFLLCEFAPTFLMKIFASDAQLISIGIQYLKIAGWSYLMTGISQCYLALFKVTDHPKTAAGISMVAVLLNIALNAILIFGLLGAPEMGVRGAALATLIARAVELVLSVAFSLRKGYLWPSLSVMFQSNSQLRKDYYRCAFPLIGAYLFWGVGFTSYTAFMGHLGADAAAANSVSAVIRDLVCCLCSGAASAAGIIIGNELGAGNEQRAKLYGKRLVLISFLIGFVSTALMMVLVPVSLRFVKLTDTASQYLSGMMLIIAFYMIGRAVNAVIINGIFASGGDTFYDLYSLGICMWGIAVPLAALGTFVFHWPVLVIYAMTCLDEVGKIPWTLHHYRKYKWVRNLTR